MTKIQIPIDARVLYEMQEYAGYAKHHFASEIAGWAHYKQDRGIYKLAPLPKQEITGATADTSSMDVTNDINYDISDMVVHWHSHVDMMPNPSGTDLQQIKDTLGIMPMLISIIVNCKGQYTARLDVKQVGGKFGVKLNSPESYEVELIPYYSNKKVSQEVLKKLRRPKPKKVNKSDFKDDEPDSLFKVESLDDYIKSRKITPSETKLIPPKYQNGKVEDVHKAILSEDTQDTFLVIDELVKLRNVTKTSYQNPNNGNTITLISGQKSPITLAITIKGEKIEDVEFRINGNLLYPTEGMKRLLESLVKYNDITEDEKNQMEILLG